MLMETVGELKRDIKELKVEVQSLQSRPFRLFRTISITVITPVVVTLASTAAALAIFGHTIN